MANKTWQTVHETPYGMQNYARWFDVENTIPMVSLSDIDGVLQSDKHKKAIFFEFKPLNGEITVGQDILHKFLSTREGQESVLIFDYYYNDQSDDKMEQDVPFKMVRYVDGKTYNFRATLADLNEAIFDWWHTGIFTLGGDAND